MVIELARKLLEISPNRDREPQILPIELGRQGLIIYLWRLVGFFTTCISKYLDRPLPPPATDEDTITEIGIFRPTP